MEPNLNLTDDPNNPIQEVIVRRKNDRKDEEGKTDNAVDVKAGGFLSGLSGFFKNNSGTIIGIVSFVSGLFGGANVNWGEVLPKLPPSEPPVVTTPVVPTTSDLESRVKILENKIDIILDLVTKSQK